MPGLVAPESEEIDFRTAKISALAREHLEQVRAFYDAAPTEPQAGARAYRALLAHYYNLLIPADATVLEVGCGSGELLKQVRAARKVGIDLAAAQITAASQRVPEEQFHVQAGELLDFPETLGSDEKFDVIIISDTLNLAADVQRLLERLHAVSHEDTRLIVNF